MTKMAKKQASAGSTIMVVEPDVLARMTVAEYLRECGFRVIEGVVAADVFTILDAGAAIDIVFAEVNLEGGLDGFALAHRLRDTHPNVQVILSAGPAGAADKAGDLCEDGPLVRPYHPREIVHRINALRARRRTT